MSAVTTSSWSQLNQRTSLSLIATLLRALPLLIGTAFMGLVLARGDAFFAQADTVARLFDEGMTLSQSVRILQGEVPYRDFWLIYGPGHYYVISALFQLFGATMAVERWWDFVARAGIALCVFLYCRPFLPYPKALIPYALTVLWLATANFYGYVMFPVLLLVLIAACCMQRALIHGQARYWLGAGLAVGAAAAFRHDIGTMACCVAGGLLALQWVGQRRHGHTAFLPSAAAFVAGLAITGLPPYAYVIATAGLSTFLYTFIIYPVTIFRNAHSLPYPNVIELVSLAVRGEQPSSHVLANVMFHVAPLYAPIIVYVGALGLLIYRQVIRRDGLTAQHQLLVLPILGLGLVLLNQALNRADRIHVVPTTVAAFAVAAWIGSTLAQQQARTLLLGALMGTAVVYPSYVLEPASRVRTAWAGAASTSCGDTLVDQRRSCTYLAEDHLQALRFVDERAAPNEPVYVGVSRHDRLFAHDALSYFLVGRPNATRYDDLLSGRVRTLEVQQEITENLVQRQVRYVILFSGFADVQEPNDSSRSSGVTWLDDFIRSEYREVLQTGRYAVWERRS